VVGAEAIGLLLLAWTLGAALVLGLGLLVTRRAESGADGFFGTLWTGFVAALAILQVWHMAWPVGGAALAVLGSLAAFGLVRGRERWRAWWSGLRRAPWIGALVFPAVLLVADRSLGPPLGNDSGGYHLASVRWTAEHPLVPGLGNLHSRLGFDSSHFLYVALLDVGPFEWRSHHVASGLILSLLLTQLLAQGARAFQEGRAADLAALLLIPAALSQALGPSASSPSPDLAVFVLGVVLGLRLLALCEQRDSISALGLVALAAALVTVKLSALGLAAAAVAVTLVVAPREPAGRRLGLQAAAVAAVFLVPWMARNVVLTGYPVYPLPWLAMPVSWRVDPADVAGLQDWIRSWARAPGLPKDQVLAGSAWIGPWARALLGNRIGVQVPIAVLASSAVVLTLSWRAGCEERHRALALLPALAAPLAGVAYWLVTAPDLRFLGASLWLLAAFAGAMAAIIAGRPGLSVALGALLAMGVLAGAARRGDLFLAPDPRGGFHATPSAAVAPLQTRSGLVVLIPQESSHCWYAPLPCTPEPRADLRLRRPGDLAAGFVRER
jgi:hypothetical protein